jgi:hypothetical protein
VRRLVWFGLGAVTGGWVVLRGREKARELAEQATPAGIGRALGRNLGERKVEVSQNFADFFSSMADSAKQREDELRTRLLLPADHPSTRP